MCDNYPPNKPPSRSAPYGATSSRTPREGLIEKDGSQRFASSAARADAATGANATSGSSLAQPARESIQATATQNVSDSRKSIRHHDCSRIYARRDCSSAHQLDERALVQYYPLIPHESQLGESDKDEVPMLHPNRYLPALNGHFLPGDTTRVQVPLSLEKKNCANCHKPAPEGSECQRKQCPNSCGYCDLRHDPLKPCPRAYLPERAWQRRKFRFDNGIPENFGIYPSEAQFAVLRTNGYIQAEDTYDKSHSRIPKFDQDGQFNPPYDLRQYRSVPVTNTSVQQSLSASKRQLQAASSSRQGSVQQQQQPHLRNRANDYRGPHTSGSEQQHQAMGAQSSYQTTNQRTSHSSQRNSYRDISHNSGNRKRKQPSEEYEDDDDTPARLAPSRLRRDNQDASTRDLFGRR